MPNSLPPQPSLYRAFVASARKFPNRTFLRTGRVRLSYGEVATRVSRLAGFLQRRLAVNPGDAVTVVSGQSSDWLIVSLAIQAIGAIEFPCDASEAPEDFRLLIRKTRCRVFIFTDRPASIRLRRIAGASRDACLLATFDAPQLKPRGRITALNEAWFNNADNPKSFSEFTSPVSAVIRTSGTTGPVKWVPVLQASFLHAARVIPRILALTKNDVILSCLPSWHLYARLAEYVAMVSGASVQYSSIEDLPGNLRNPGVTVFPSFPEIWEQIYHSVLGALAQSRIRRVVLFCIDLVIAADRTFAHWFGRRRLERKRATFGDMLKLSYLLPVRWLLQRTVFSAIRKRVSPTLRYAIMGDAPLPLVVDETLRALGFEVLEGYGSTEQCVTALRRPARNFPGAVGRVLPGVHVTIDYAAGAVWNGSRVGEIVVSGENVCNGYFSTLEALSLEHVPGRPYATGDFGSVDEQGNLWIAGRVVNAFRLKGGEWIFPELVENVLRGSAYVGRVLVFGAGQPGTVALIVPDFYQLLRWAVRHGFAESDAQKAHNPEKFPLFWKKLLRGPAHDLYRRQFRSLLADSGLPEFAKPRSWALVAHPFHRGSELTMTLKPRRAVIARKYATELRKVMLEL